MYLSTYCFGKTLRHGWIAVRHVQIDQARATADHRMHHADHSSTQRFFERRKCRDATGVLRLVGSLRRLRAFGRAGTLIGDDTLRPEERVHRPAPNLRSVPPAQEVFG